MKNVRTDLAIETAEILTEDTSYIEGIRVKNLESEDKNISLCKVEIYNENGEKVMGKPIGNYITIESSSIKENDSAQHERIIKLMGKTLVELCRLKKDDVILIVGLGNRDVTPDALGPKVVSKILVTRHIKESIPEDIKDSVRSVCAVAPGVMGVTGIETSEMIKSIAESVKPDVVIAIDALAARKTSRINATIQLSDTGISPGAGMGNNRKVLNEEELGVPVVAIGVPTVVDAATLANDTMDNMIEAMIDECESGSEFYKMLESLDKDEKYRLIRDVLDPYTENMFVTPKEIDAVMERVSNIIANAVNIALHPGITAEDINRYFN